MPHWVEDTFWAALACCPGWVFAAPTSPPRSVCLSPARCRSLPLASTATGWSGSASRALAGELGGAGCWFCAYPVSGLSQHIGPVVPGYGRLLWKTREHAAGRGRAALAPVMPSSTRDICPAQRPHALWKQVPQQGWDSGPLPLPGVESEAHRPFLKCWGGVTPWC